MSDTDSPTPEPSSATGTLPAPNAWAPPPRVPLGSGTVWPEHVWPAVKDAAAPTPVLAGALAAGLVAALALRLDVPGLGFLLTGLAMLGAALGTALRRPTATQAVAAVATVALLSVGVVRAAGWLFALCFVAAALTGSIALVGGRSWRALLLGAVAMPLVPFRALVWSGRGFGRLRSGNPLAGRVVGVSAISALLMLVFGGLFYGADSVFAKGIDAALPDFSAGTVIGNAFLAAVVTVLTLAAACLAYLPPAFDAIGATERRPVRRWEWAVPLGLLNALFAVFVAIQLGVLFGNLHHTLHTREEFAAYAREGFWQLMTVTVLTLGVIAVANAKASRETARDRVLIRVLLGGLSVFSLVIVASAVVRLVRFEKDFGFTEARVFAHTVELWLGVVFLLVLLAGVRLRAAWLPRAVLGTAVLALLALAALNPDAYIATRNVQRFHDTGKVDVHYLGGLSGDAVPALQKLHEPARSCSLRLIDFWHPAGRDDEPWYTFNVGRAAARRSLAEAPPNATLTCPYENRSDLNGD